MGHVIIRNAAIETRQQHYMTLIAPTIPMMDEENYLSGFVALILLSTWGDRHWLNM